MVSSAKRGAYYKARTKKWLLAQGWQVADMEVVRWVHRPGAERIPVKRDQFGSDLLIMNRHVLVFVQVKGGKMAATGNFPDARRTFAAFTFPPSAQCWVVAWTLRARQPRIVDCTPREVTYAQHEGHEDVDGDVRGRDAGPGRVSARRPRSGLQPF